MSGFDESKAPNEENFNDHFRWYLFE
jgi:hypothetical protein